MIISKAAIDLIVFSEVTSKAHFDKKLFGIIWPGGDSGATIGIGYDLGYQTSKSIEVDWIKEIGAYQVSILKMFAGLRGDKAKMYIAGNKLAAMVNIPFQAAYNVFLKASLPLYAKRAERIYPGLSELQPDAAGAIVSLVYNRGTNLDGDRRAEMKAIVPLVAAKDYTGIAAQIDKSKRLWNNGLVQRREREAQLVVGAVRNYVKDELIELYP